MVKNNGAPTLIRFYLLLKCMDKEEGLQAQIDLLKSLIEPHENELFKFLIVISHIRVRSALQQEYILKVLLSHIND